MLRLAFAAVPILFFYGALLVFVTDIPNSDDFDVFLAFLNSFLSEDKFSNKIALIFSPHNEHYLVPSRSLALLTYFLTGAIQIKWIVIAGNISLILMLYQFTRLTNCSSEKLILPVSLLLFQLQYFEAAAWATAAVQNLWVYCLALLAIHLSRSQTAFAALIAVLVTLTQGNGVVCLIAISIVFAFEKQLIKSFCWALGAGTLLTILHYRSFLDNSSQDVEILNILNYFLSFLGSAFSYSQHGLALSAGVLFFMIFLLLTLKKYYKQNPELYCFILFLLGTAAVTALTRVPFGMKASYLQSRYKIVSILLVISYGIALSELYGARIKKLYAPAVLAATLFCSYSNFINLPQLVLRNELLNDSMLRWNISKQGLAFPAPGHADRILTQSIDNGSYQPPKNTNNYKTSTIATITNIKSPSQIHHTFEHVLLDKGSLIVDGWCFRDNPKTRDMSDTTIYISLISDERTYFFSTEKRLRPDVSAHLGYKLNNSGFFAFIDTSQLEENTYQLGVAISFKKGTFHKKTKRNVIIEH